jgi:Flp pilus assembly pilin Flp
MGWEASEAPGGEPSGRRPRRSLLRRFVADERGTSDVEYVLLTAMVVLPILSISYFPMKANQAVFGRVAPWTHVPFP